MVTITVHGKTAKIIIDGIQTTTTGISVVNDIVKATGTSEITPRIETIGSVNYGLYNSVIETLKQNGMSYTVIHRSSL